MFFAIPIYFVIAIIVASILLLGIGAGAIFIHRRKRTKAKVQKICDAYELYNSQLLTDCYDMIKRIKSLSQYSRSYEVKYIENQKKYDSLVNKTGAALKEEIDSMKNLLATKNLPALKKIIPACEKATNDFGTFVGVLNKDLQETLKEDRKAREACLHIKEKYRTIHEFYNTNINDLRPLEKPFNVIFSRADKFFVNYDSLIDHAQFQEASQLLPSMENVFDAVLNIMNDLPGLANLIYVIIPNKIDSIINEVQELVKEQYILDNLNIPKFITGIRKILENEASKLEMLETFEVNKNLMAVQDSLHDLELKLAAEKEAKAKFLSDQDTLSISSYEIEKKYARLVNSLPSYQKAYLLEKKQVDSILSLRNDVETVGYLKRELDGYLDAGNKQPYSVVSYRVTKMKEEINKVTQTMQEYQDYLDKVKQDSEHIFSEIRTLYLRLKQAMYKLRVNINSKSLNDVYSKKIHIIFDNLKNIDSLLTTKPVDVVSASSLFNSVFQNSNTLIDEINILEERCKKAESSILYANVYRVDFFDSRPNLDRAEQAFIEGDFERATSESLKVIEMFKTR